MGDPVVTARLIRAERIRLGLTQDQAAARLGVSRGTYRQLEERANPQLETLRALQSAGYDIRRIAPWLFMGPD